MLKFIILTMFFIFTVNAEAMKFQVAQDGDVNVQFLGQSAQYNNVIGFNLFDDPTFIPVSDVRTFSNHGVDIGYSLNLGYHSAGTIIDVSNWVPETGDIWWSDTHRNSDGINHIYSSTFGNHTYIGFEDLRGGGDLDFNDTTFMMSNVIPSVPEPETYLMLVIGLLVMKYLKIFRPTQVKYPLSEIKEEK